MTTVDARSDLLGAERSRREWPAWQVPAAAVPEWIALVDALFEAGAEPACADEPDRWWSKQPRDLEWAQLACALCPVRDACRAYGLAAGERHGVWGGLTPADRESCGR